jgi:hypothetical protein
LEATTANTVVVPCANKVEGWAMADARLGYFEKPGPLIPTETIVEERKDNSCCAVNTILVVMCEAKGWSKSQWNASVRMSVMRIVVDPESESLPVTSFPFCSFRIFS